MIAFNVGLGVLIFTGAQTEPMKHLLICLLVFATAMAALWINYPNSLASNRRLLLILSVCFCSSSACDSSSQTSRTATIRRVRAAALSLRVRAAAPLRAYWPPSRLYAALFAASGARSCCRSIDPVFIVLSLITGFIAVFVTCRCAAAAASSARDSTSALPRGCSPSRSALISPISSRAARTGVSLACKASMPSAWASPPRRRQRHPARAGNALRRHDRHFVAGNGGHESPAPAPSLDGSAGHLPPQPRRREPRQRPPPRP